MGSCMPPWEVCFFGGRGGSAPKASRGFAATLTCSFGCGSMYLWNSFHPKFVGLNNANPIGWSHQELIREKDMKEELWPQPSWLVEMSKVNWLLLLNRFTSQLGGKSRVIHGHMWWQLGSHIVSSLCFIKFMGSKLMAELWQGLFFGRLHIVTGRDCVRQFPIILQKCKIAIESHPL